MNMPQPIILNAGEGRHYDMGAIRATFKADDAETEGRFSVSEWYLDPMHEGPGAHKHDENDEVFYILKGTASVLIGETWHDLSAGSFCFTPRGVMHDFRNETTEPMCLLNVFLPGPFEQLMPAIVDWYRQHPAKRLDLPSGQDGARPEELNASNDD